MELTYSKLMELREIAEQSIVEMGYKVPNYKWCLDTRATRRAGQCRNNAKEIGVSPKVMKYHPEEKVLNTCVHELLHAVAWEQLNYTGHHGKPWKQLANKYNRLYPNRMPITATYTATEEQKQSAKYRILCDGCGKISTRQKEGKFIRDVKRNGGAEWRCKCGSKGSFKLI